MALAEDIRERAFRYLSDSGDDALRAFEDWLMEASWDAHLTDADAAEFAYRIKLLLAEYTSGDRSEVDLRRALVPMLQQGDWLRAERVEPSKSTLAKRPTRVLEQVY